METNSVFHTTPLLVLKRIFRFLPKSDLLMIRQTCRLFRDASYYEINSRNHDKKITFNNSIDFNDYYNCFSSVQYPHPDYSLFHTNFSIRCRLNWEQSDQFLTLGKFVKKLEVYLGSFDQLGGVCFIIKMCPNLEELSHLTTTWSKPISWLSILPETKIKKLKFPGHSIRNKDNHKYMIQPILRASPFLEELRFFNPISDNWLLESLELIVNFKRLTALSLESFPLGATEMLGNFQLKYLRFTFLNVGQGLQNMLYQLLDAQSQSLESFLVWGIGNNTGREEWEKHPILFPEMPRLKHLRLGLSVDLEFDAEEVVLFVPIDFCRQFPQLKSFILSGDASNCNIGAFFSALHSPHGGLTGVELPSGILRNEIINASRMFPNVTVKELIVGPTVQSATSVVFQVWSNIESLYLLYNDPQPDSFLTGLPQAICDDIKTLNEPRDEVLQREPWLSNSIANLKNLREFTMSSQYDHPGEVSNGCIWAFSKLSKLKYIRLENHEANIINENGIRALCKALPGLKLNNKASPAFECRHFDWGDSEAHPLYNEDLRKYNN